MILVRLAKEEEGVGISAGAHLAGVKSAMLMQNHGFLASINGIVSCAQLYRIPLLMLISYRGEFGERDPWQTEGGGVTEDLLRALRIPFSYLDRPDHVAHAHRQGADAGVVVQQAGRAAAVPRPDVGGRMTRLDALKAIYPSLERHVVVTIMGAVAAELQSIGHRPNFFYLQHAMGLASSMGLGIALSKPDRHVVVFDGDGSVLMNLGGLTTLARYRPRNLMHVVFDNESLLSVGARRFSDGDLHRQRSRRHRRGRRHRAHGNRLDARRVHARLRRGARGRRSDDDRGQGRSRSVPRRTSPICRCSRTGSSSSGTCDRSGRSPR